MTSVFSLIVLAVSPGCGVDPSGPNSTNSGAWPSLESLGLLFVPKAPGFFFLLRGAQSAGLLLTWNIIDPATKGNQKIAGGNPKFERVLG